MKELCNPFSKHSSLLKIRKLFPGHSLGSTINEVWPALAISLAVSFHNVISLREFWLEPVNLGQHFTSKIES